MLQAKSCCRTSLQTFWRIRHFVFTKRRSAKFCIAKFGGGSRMCSSASLLPPPSGSPTSPSSRRGRLLIPLNIPQAELLCRTPYVVMAEGVGFEPTSPFGEAVFKTAALDHSAIPP